VQGAKTVQITPIQVEDSEPAIDEEQGEQLQEHELSLQDE